MDLLLIIETPDSEIKSKNENSGDVYFQTITFLFPDTSTFDIDQMCESINDFVKSEICVTTNHEFEITDKTLFIFGRYGDLVPEGTVKVNVDHYETEMAVEEPFMLTEQFVYFTISIISEMLQFKDEWASNKYISVTLENKSFPISLMINDANQSLERTLCIKLDTSSEPMNERRRDLGFHFAVDTNWKTDETFTQYLVRVEILRFSKTMISDGSEGRANGQFTERRTSYKLIVYNLYYDWYTSLGKTSKGGLPLYWNPKFIDLNNSCLIPYGYGSDVNRSSLALNTTLPVAYGDVYRQLMTKYSNIDARLYELRTMASLIDPPNLLGLEAVLDEPQVLLFDRYRTHVLEVYIAKASMRMLMPSHILDLSYPSARHLIYSMAFESDGAITYMIDTLTLEHYNKVFLLLDSREKGHVNRTWNYSNMIGKGRYHKPSEYLQSLKFILCGKMPFRPLFNKSHIMILSSLVSNEVIGLEPYEQLCQQAINNLLRSFRQIEFGVMLLNNPMRNSLSGFTEHSGMKLVNIDDEIRVHYIETSVPKTIIDSIFTDRSISHAFSRGTTWIGNSVVDIITEEDFMVRSRIESLNIVVDLDV